MLDACIRWWEFRTWISLLKTVILSRPFPNNSTGELPWSTLFRWCTAELRSPYQGVAGCQGCCSPPQATALVASLGVKTVRLSCYSSVPVLYFLFCDVNMYDMSVRLFPACIFSLVLYSLPHFLELYKVFFLEHVGEKLCNIIILKRSRWGKVKDPNTTTITD
jgi:hypothetical protein